MPAWMSMMSSRDPGVLGFYGFRNRVDYSYDKLSFANSRSAFSGLRGVPFPTFEIPLRARERMAA